MKKIIVVSALIISIVGIVFAFKITKNSQTPEYTIINGIENFKSIDSHSDDSYLLVYPSDIRVSQENTIVREISKSGEILSQYEIRDDAFRRVNPHQKPNDYNKLYMSLYGEAAIENGYYTYDISSHTFEKVETPYFEYETGVDSISHYGEDILFKTIVSHKTGDQVINVETGEFKVSISNFSNEDSY